jgi:saccharopine dehydrogenase (NAD+, L-lysine-forming)
MAMTTIALIREGKIPADNRVALTPAQCKWVQRQYGIKILVQHSAHRCFSDKEYQRTGIEVREDVATAEIFIGIKEVPITDLVEGKTYLFFSHTKKKQAYNQKLFQTIIARKISLIDFECFEHEDGQRIIGFGFFAGIVGAHNGMMAYGNRTKTFLLERVYKQKDFRSLIHTYFGLKLPNIKIAVTGSGRVAHGITEIMNLMGVIEVEKEEYLERQFSYPVYVQLKGADLYLHEVDNFYSREHFHFHPYEFRCLFTPYTAETDILMNGIYWDKLAPRLFEKEDIARSDFRIQTIADITDDKNGSIPINLGDQSIEDPVYGVDKKTGKKTTPYLPGSVDVMAVGNLPNELPRDASRYFGEQLIKYILPDLLTGETQVIKKATIVKNGIITAPYNYLQDYADGH